MKKIMLVIFVMTMLIASVEAADGTLGTTSTSTIVAGITVPFLVKVSKFTGINLGTFDGINAKSGNDNGCVYSNNTGSYKVTATSQYNASSTKFLMKSGSGSDTVELTVSWCSDVGGLSCSGLSYGVAATKSGADTTSIDCDSSNNVSVKVDVTAAAMRDASPATYNGDLYILIVPN